MRSDWPPPAASGLEADRREALFFRRPRRTRRQAVNVSGRDESGELPGQVVPKLAGRIRQGQDRLAGGLQGVSVASPGEGRRRQAPSVWRENQDPGLQASYSVERRS